MIAIISAYAFLYSLESRVKSTVLFLIGFAGTLTGQSRGSELSLILCLVILGAAWAKTNKRAAFIFTFSLIVSILFSGAVVASIGGGRIWNTFNKGENIQTIESASGRSEIWKFVLHYCMDHPQGMGYIAGFRMIFREQYASGLHVTVNNIGNSHNSFIDILADAGWLALAVYLIIIVKIVLLAWRYGKKRGLAAMASDAASQHVIRCALVLLVSCLANGMDTADYNVPLKATFYVQYLIIAIILGLSARMIASSRARHISSGK
jgi:O-antigen ligase